MDFELEQSVLPSRLNVNNSPPPSGGAFWKDLYIFHLSTSWSILSYAIHELKKMMTSFFQNDIAFGTTNDIIIFQLARLYHNRHTLF